VKSLGAILLQTTTPECESKERPAFPARTAVVYLIIVFDVGLLIADRYTGSRPIRAR
jgi:hypothetical protein